MATQNDVSGDSNCAVVLELGENPETDLYR